MTALNGPIPWALGRETRLGKNACDEQVSSAALEQTTFAQPSLGKKNSKAGDAKRSSTSIATINPEFKDLAQTWGWKMITVHEKMYPWPSSGYHPVLGLRWSKSSEQHGQDKHPRGSVGYARDRLFDSAPPSAVSRDKSVRRFAQDDGFVGDLKKTSQTS